MNLKPAVKYHLTDNVKSIAVFYLVIYIIIAAFFCIGAVLNGNSAISIGLNNKNTNLNGLDSATIIFLFIVGLNSFKTQFKMLVQNGLSRKTFFSGFMLSALAISVIMSLVDMLNGTLLGAFYNSYVTIFESLYGLRYNFQAPFYNVFFYVDIFLWSLFIYLSVTVIGFFLTTLYYRMNKMQTIAVSVLVPAFFIVVLPILDWQFTKGTLSMTMVNILSAAFGVGPQYGFNPYLGVMSSIVICALFGWLSYLLVRTAPLKK